LRGRVGRAHAAPVKQDQAGERCQRAEEQGEAWILPRDVEVAVTAARHHQVRDLQWQRRRFVIAVLATALVFGMTLLMTGTDASVHDEGWRIVAALGADAWLVADGASGPFTTSTPIPAAEISGEFNLNGIAATANGKALIVAHSVNEQLYTVDPTTGASAAIAGVSLPNVDACCWRRGGCGRCRTSATR
jgi:hypothetical protein